MNTSHPNRRFIAITLSLAMVLLSLQTPIANAAMISTSTLLADQQAKQQRQISLKYLDTKKAQDILLSLGVTPESAKKRIHAMSTEELTQFTDQIGNLPAGGDSLFGIVILAFFVLIVLDLLGTTDIFPAIDPIN